MHRIIVANRRGHQVIEWETTDTEEARARIEDGRATPRDQTLVNYAGAGR